MSLASDDAIAAALAKHPDWQRAGDRLVRRIDFANFGDAMAFVARAAVEIERADHHPEWTNSYARLDIAYTSHDVGGISERDLDAIATIDRLLRG